MERDFKGVWIPKEVWLDERLNALEKVILTEIDSLDSSERGCYASNKHISEFCQCSETKVSTAITKLIKIGYIYVQKFDGRQRELKSRLSKFERQTLNSSKADSQNLKESNTYSNTDNNTLREKDNNVEQSPTVSIPYFEIVDYLNQKISTQYRSTSKKTQSLIKSRFNEGFTLEDFKTVIDKKSFQWLNNPKMQTYLRPETLFGSKFEGYLNEQIGGYGNAKPISTHGEYDSSGRKLL